MPIRLTEIVTPLKPLEDKLYSEIVGRIKQDDSSVPVRERGYYYYTRYEVGADYPVVARRRGSMKAPEQVLLDPGIGFHKVGAQNWALLARLEALARTDALLGALHEALVGPLAPEDRPAPKAGR